MIADQILGILREYTDPAVPLSEDTPLFEGGLDLDSIGFLQLVLKIEAHTGTRLRDEDLTEDALCSVGAFIAQVTRKAAG